MAKLETHAVVFEAREMVNVECSMRILYATNEERDYFKKNEWRKTSALNFALD